MTRRILVTLVTLVALAPPALAATDAPSTARRAAAHDARVLPFIADDYARALAEARARQVPLFIEAWAPW